VLNLRGNQRTGGEHSRKEGGKVFGGGSRATVDPRYIIDLLARIVTVSLETMQLVDALPALDIRTEQ
jgi:predicted helicase